MFTIIKKCVILQRKTVRDVAQPGSALRSGRRGRKFESCHPDFVKASLSFRLAFLTRDPRLLDARRWIVPCLVSRSPASKMHKER